MATRYGDLLRANNIRRKQSTQSPYGTGTPEATSLRPTPSYVTRLAGRPQSTPVAMARIRKRKRTR